MPVLTSLLGDAAVCSGEEIARASAMLPELIKQRTRDALEPTKIVDGVNCVRGIGVGHSASFLD